MLKTLRCRLTALFTGLTALVLGGALLVTGSLSTSQYAASAETLFENTLHSLCSRLSDAGSVTDTWLAEQETESNCLIFLCDNGAALHFKGAQPLDAARRAALAQAAGEAARQAGLDETLRQSDGSARPQTVRFLLNEGAYRGAASLLPRGRSGAYLTLVLLQNQDFITRHKRQTAFLYTALWLAGSALLAGISWFLAGRALVPTRQALQRQNEFIAAASHELRSPLAVIRASLDALQTPALSREDRLPMLGIAQAEVDRLSRLTGDLLLLAGSDAGALSVHLTPTAPDTLCIELYEQFYPLARQQDHPLTLELPDGPVPPVPADSERLRQLLAILLHNALEHTPAGTPVELVLCYTPGSGAPVSFAVTDHGPGIPDAEKEHIFERFYRADESRTDKSHFGLGLSVAAELARLHAAKLTVCDTPGGGATLRVSLPVAP